MSGLLSYDKLLERSREISLLNSAASTLSWDQETCLPAKGVAYRSEQLAYIAGKAHELFTAPEVGDWIAACEDEGSFDPLTVEGTNVREWRRAYDRATRLPTDLVKELQKTTALARSVWIDARKQNNFSVFLPSLEKIIDLKRRCADLWGYDDSPYDALLDEYEPDARSADLSALFVELESALRGIVAELSEVSRSIPEDELKGDYPVAGQQAFNRKVAEAIGFDFEAGRIDTTTHPFCTGLGPLDTRLTTRYDESNFVSSLYGVLHEAGHGLYDQGLPEEHFGTPSGSAVSLGIHESQSRLWENQVGRTLAFWEHWLPTACEHFPSLRKFTPERIAAAVNRVVPSHVRVEADEVTYDLHIILRFRVEFELMEGRLEPADIPRFWNENFEENFGLKVPGDSSGCLQDIHWSLGAFGYFPTYTLGNLNAAQLFRAALDEDPSRNEELAKGEYGGLLRWLRANVHAKGQQLPSGDLIAAATGKPTSSEAYLHHLRSKAELLAQFA